MSLAIFDKRRDHGNKEIKIEYYLLGNEMIVVFEGNLDQSSSAINDNETMQQTFNRDFFSGRCSYEGSDKMHCYPNKWLNNS